MDYDPQTNRCVGFVLPLNSDGLPEKDAFLATSYESIATYFEQENRSKFAYVYMAQPVLDGSPPFCLACLGTDNRFVYHTVLQRWKYIVTELKKYDITVLSFGSDGDSRLLKSMLIMLQSHPQQVHDFDPQALANTLPVPQEWVTWFKLPKQRIVMCQDIVHLGVKLKARLMKPGIVLPMGTYVASAAHL